jgi:thioesterase domain-containing protein
LQPDDDFFDLGGDSLMAINMVMELRRSFSIDIAFGQVFRLRTLRAISAAIETKADISRSEASLIQLGARRRWTRGPRGGAHLICICGIRLYEQLADAIGAPHQVSGVFLPIEEELLLGQAAPRLQEMAAMYGKVVRAAQPHGPYRLAGVSFGGILAFELARQLQARGETVDFLGIFDSSLPHTISRWTRLQGHARLAIRQGLPYLTGRVGNQMNRLFARTDALGRSPFGTASAKVASGDLARIRGRLYAAAEAEYHRTMPSIHGDIHYFRASEKSALEAEVVPPDYNWSRFVKGDCHVHEVPGGHISMLAAPAVSVVGEIVRTSLEVCVKSPVQSAMRV